MGIKNIEPEGILVIIGLGALALWISVLIFGNYLIPAFYPSVVRAITFSVFVIMMGYACIYDENGDCGYYIWWALMWVCFVMSVWRYGDEKYFASIFWFLVFISNIVIGIIAWIVSAAERAAKAAKREIKRAAKEIAKEVTQFFKDIIDFIIDVFSIRNSVKTKCPAALKVKILEKKKNAVNVGIFGSNNVMIAREEIISYEGVSPDIYKGQEIYC